MRVLPPLFYRCVCHTSHEGTPVSNPVLAGPRARETRRGAAAAAGAGEAAAGAGGMEHAPMAGVQGGGYDLLRVVERDGDPAWFPNWRLIGGVLPDSTSASPVGDYHAASVPSARAAGTRGTPDGFAIDALPADEFTSNGLLYSDHAFTSTSTAQEGRWFCFCTSISWCRPSHAAVT